MLGTPVSVCLSKRHTSCTVAVIVEVTGQKTRASVTGEVREVAVKHGLAEWGESVLPILFTQYAYHFLLGEVSVEFEFVEHIVCNGQEIFTGHVTFGVVPTAEFIEGGHASEVLKIGRESTLLVRQVLLEELFAEYRHLDMTLGDAFLESDSLLPLMFFLEEFFKLGKKVCPNCDENMSITE